MTAGAWRDTLEQLPSSDTAVDAFLDIVDFSVRCGVSCIAEYVFRAHRPDDLERVRAARRCGRDHHALFRSRASIDRTQHG